MAAVKSTVEQAFLLALWREECKIIFKEKSLRLL
jgi:hypothetical protein